MRRTHELSTQAAGIPCRPAAGVPAVEFGPEGGGHHGPDEWVSISSLDRYRRSLVEFVRLVPARLETTRVRVA